MAWTENQREAAGWLQVKLRLRTEDAAALKALAARRGTNVSETVAELVRTAGARKRKGPALP